MQIRLYTQEPLYIGKTVLLTQEQGHYLRNVLRASVGAELLLFNGKEGEFSAILSSLSKKEASVEICRQTRTNDETEKKEVTLYFSILKRNHTELVIEKATELGVTKIIPMITQYTSNKHINLDRLQSIVIEACEQCRRIELPELLAPMSLEEVLLTQNENSPLLVHLDETGQGQKAEIVFKDQKDISFLVGPEGGFSEKERAQIAKTPNTKSMDLGKNILRAETACIATLSLFLCR